MSRRALAGLCALLPLPLLMLLLGALPAPDRVPVGWQGGPTEWSSGASFGSTTLTVVALAAIAAALVAVLRRAFPEGWSRWLVALAAGVGWGAVALYALTVRRTDAVGPAQVEAVWPLLGVALGVLAAGVTYGVHGRRLPDLAEARARVPERARVHALRGRAVQPVGEWTTPVASGTLLVIALGVMGGAVVVAAVALLQGQGWLLAGLGLLVMGVTALLALAWSAVELRVDETGLRILSRRVPGFTLSGVPAEEVLGVEVLDLDPMAWGGYGLRPGPERTAYIVDGGPGLVVWKRDGRRLALQVTEGDEQARAGARALLRAAGQALGKKSSSD